MTVRLLYVPIDGRCGYTGTSSARVTYHDDPDLSWEVPASPLPYDGEIPAEVLALAQRRRVERDG